MARDLDDEWERIVKKDKYLLEKIERKSRNQNSTKLDEMKQDVLNRIISKK